jgi:hypothetical protein
MIWRDHVALIGLSGAKMFRSEREGEKKETCMPLLVALYSTRTFPYPLRAEGGGIRINTTAKLMGSATRFLGPQVLYQISLVLCQRHSSGPQTIHSRHLFALKHLSHAVRMHTYAYIFATRTPRHVFSR